MLEEVELLVGGRGPEVVAYDDEVLSLCVTVFFSSRLRPAYEAIGLSLDGLERRQFEVETLVAGDLVGAAD
ncbi:MAG TPA: hypothetical protein VFA19_07225 [Gaiellaceae bacterium]|nr:hypothetical protein [Gaiellaceae bacterium]